MSNLTHTHDAGMRLSGEKNCDSTNVLFTILTFVDGNLREAEYNVNFDLRAQHYWGRWPQIQKFGHLRQITFILPGEVENFTKIVKDKLIKIEKNFWRFWKKFIKNMGESSWMYLHIPGRILRNFERMLWDLVFYLTLTTSQKDLQNCCEIFSQSL